MRQHRESGYILVGVLLAITVLSVVGVSLVSLSTNSIKTSSAERKNQAVYYIAEAGLNYKINKLETEVQSAFNDFINNQSDKSEENFHKFLDSRFTIENYEQFEEINLNDTNFTRPVAKIIVEPLAELGKYRIISVGDINGEERTVKQDLEIKWLGTEKNNENFGELKPFAIFTEGDMQFTGNGIVYGDIAAPSENNIRSTGSLHVNGHKYTPPKDENNNIVTLPSLPPFPQVESNQCLDSTLVDMNCNINMNHSRNETVVLNNHAKLNKLSITGIGDLTIDVGNDNRVLEIEELLLTGSGTIKIKGNGSLSLFINNKLSMVGHTQLNEKGKASNLNIFYKGTETITLTGSQTIYGSLFVDKVNLTLTGSSNIYGNIFSNGNNVTFTGSAEMRSQLIIVPNGKVTLTGGGRFYGQIFAKSFSATGSTEVWFVDCHDYSTQPLIAPHVCPDSVTTGPISIEAFTNGGNQPGNGNGEQNPSKGGFEIHLIGNIMEID